MSDGPHRSLNMAQHWKKLAARADNDAYCDDEAKSQFQKALQKDWIKGIPKKLHAGITAIFDGANGSLFPEDRVEQLRQLEHYAAGHGLAQLYLDQAKRMANFGGYSSADVVSCVLKSWGARRVRQIEEHYLRNASGESSDHIRSRLEHVCDASASHGLANQLTASSKPASINANRKKSGIDDGVSL